MEPRATPESGHVMTGEDQQRAQIAGGTLAVLAAGSLGGVAASLYLVNQAPLLLVLLSPIGRHVMLVAPLVDPWVLIPAVAARRMLFYLASFHLGRALGDPAIVWLEARAGAFGRFVRWVEGLFVRWGKGLVLVATSPTVSVLAGISGMRARTFAALAIPGLLVRLWVMVQFAELLRGPIEALLAWIDEHWLPGTVVLVTVIALHRWRLARRAALNRREPLATGPEGPLP
ncbi:MAG: hypothetical protein HKP30_08775 [Myxococcales bacterium]|nr:hypothetical protein [Myxococcales bacterium]